MYQNDKSLYALSKCTKRNIQKRLIVYYSKKPAMHGCKYSNIQNFIPVGMSQILGHTWYLLGNFFEWFRQPS
jgi:hypothetical protein